MPILRIGVSIDGWNWAVSKLRQIHCCRICRPSAVRMSTQKSSRTRSFHLRKTTFNITHDLVPRMLGFFQSLHENVSVDGWSSMIFPSKMEEFEVVHLWFPELSQIPWRHRGSAHGVMRELGMEPQGGQNFTSTFSWLYWNIHPHSPQNIPTWDDQTACFLHGFYYGFYYGTLVCILEIIGTFHHFSTSKPMSGASELLHLRNHQAIPHRHQHGAQVLAMSSAEGGHDSGNIWKHMENTTAIHC